MSKNVQNRALALPSNNVGGLRNETYKILISRMKKSIEDGYYLEAIALQESIIADRLESRLNFLSQSSNYSFITLDTLVRTFGDNKSIEPNLNLKNLVITQVKNWKEGRNKALHEMAKISDNDLLTWNEKQEKVKTIAEEGLVLFRDVDNMVRSLK